MKVRFLLFLLLGLSAFVGIYEFSSAEYADVILNSKKESMRAAGVKDVMFPHWFHRIRFKCKVCHEDIFILKAGANDIDMNKIMNGEYCGRCHNGVIAWEPLYCDRCHSWEPGWEPGFVQHSRKIADAGSESAAGSGIIAPKPPDSAAGSGLKAPTVKAPTVTAPKK